MFLFHVLEATVCQLHVGKQDGTGFLRYNMDTLQFSYSNVIRSDCGVLQLAVFELTSEGLRLGELSQGRDLSNLSSHCKNSELVTAQV